MTTALQIADWMTARAHESGTSDLTNMKLNKLLYFAQAHHLAATGRPLFEDDLEAWDHGPVVYAVYDKFREFGRDPVSTASVGRPDLGEVSEDILEQVWKLYARRSASTLRTMSHDDAPYVAHHTGESRVVIPANEIRDYYHRDVPKRERITSPYVDYIDERDEAAMDAASTTQAVEKALAYLLA